MTVFNNRITYRGLASLIIILSTPFIRFWVLGKSVMTLSMLLVIPLLLLSMVSKNNETPLNSQTFYREIIVFTLLFSLSALYAVFEYHFSFSSEKVQVFTILLFLCSWNKTESWISVLITYMVSLFFIDLYINNPVFFDGDRAYVPLTDDTYLDPNMVGASFIIPGIYSFVVLLENNKLWYKILHGALFMAILYASFIGGSRSCLMAMILGICVYEAKNFTFKSLMKVTIAVILFLIIIYPIFKGYLPSSFIDRWTVGSVVESGGSNRTEIWSNYMTRWFYEIDFSTMFFGFGKEACVSYLGFAAHQTFIEYLWSIGLVGLIFYIYILSKIYQYIKNSGSALGLAVFVATLIWSCTISANNQLILWTLYFQAIMIAKSNLRAGFFNNGFIERSK